MHSKLLPPGKTVRADFYCQQSPRLYQPIEKKIDSNFLLPSSTVTKARQYALLATKKLREFKWENFSYSVI